MVFYSRYFIHEMLLLFFTALTLGAGWRYAQTRSARWAVLTGAGLGLMFATKETFVITVAAAEVAMCAARQGRFWPLHDALYRQQDRWAPLAQPRDTLLALAERAGVNRAKLLACLNAGDARNEVALDAQRAGRAGAHATPSFYIEGGLLEGAPYTPEPMRRLLDSIYAVRARPAK